MNNDDTLSGAVQATTPAEKPADSGKTGEIKLTLSEQEASMIHSLLADYDYAWESDQEVDCKHVLVRKDKIGTYPYVPEAPDPSLLKPVYDWINHKWADKSAKTLTELTQNVKDLVQKNSNTTEAINLIKKSQQVGDQQSFAVTKAITKVMQAQENTNKLIQSMQRVMLSLVPKNQPNVPASNPAVTQPEQKTQATQPTQASEAKEENGGN